MFSQLVTIAAAQLLSSPTQGYERITPQAAAERIAQCAAGSVTTRFEPELDTYVLSVASSGPITDKQVACIAQAAQFYQVELPPDAQRRLDALTEARGKALAAAYSRKWLVAHNLLGRLPAYNAGVTNDAAFARRIEKLCKAKGAFGSQYGLHALSPEWAARQRDVPEEDGAFACVINVAFASGYEIGFIGNAQVTP